MGRRSSKPIERRHVFLYEGDWERLQILYSDSIGAGGAIREIIHGTLRRLEDRAAQQNKAVIPGKELTPDVERDLINELAPDSSD